MPFLLTDEQAHQIAAHLNGTMNDVEASIAAIMADVPDSYDPSVYVDEMNERLEIIGIQMCEGCGWWMEIAELDQTDESKGAGLCRDCGEDERHAEA